MRYTGRRPTGRLCCWAVVAIACAVGLFGGEAVAAGAAPDPQSGPATTTVTDTVYNADGSAAQGNLILTWPAFTDRGRNAGRGGHDEYGAGYEWNVQRESGAECGRGAGGSVLHGGLPDWAGSGEN